MIEKDHIRVRSTEMLQTQDLRLAWRRGFEILNSFKTPELTYGHTDFAQFFGELIHTIEDEGFAIVELMGEPLSNKTFAASQTAQFLEKTGVEVFYIPLVDVIRAGKIEGIVDRERSFGDFTTEEFTKLSKFYFWLHLNAARKLTEKWTREGKAVIIGETMGLPAAMLDEHGQVVIFDKTTTAISELIETYNAFVAACYQTAQGRNEGKQLRRHLAQIETPEEMTQLVEEANIDPGSSSLQTAQKTFQASGLPWFAIDKIENQINLMILHLAREEGVKLPESIREAHDFSKHPNIRNRLMGNFFLPYVLQKLGVAQTRAIVCRSHKMGQKRHRYSLEEVNFVNILYKLRGSTP